MSPPLSSSTTTTTTSLVTGAFGIQRFARTRLLSLHDACVAVAQNPHQRQTKIEKSFQAMRSKKNKKRYLTEALDKTQYGQYLVDPSKNLFEQYSTTSNSSNQNNCDDDMNNNMFFTAINSEPSKRSTAASSNQNHQLQRKLQRREDLPRHVPRHVVQPLQEPPFSDFSPIAKFSPIPLFAISSASSEATSSSSLFKWDPFNNNNVRNHPEASTSSLSWMPQVRTATSSSTKNDIQKQVLPKHIVPTTLAVLVREKTLVKNQVLINEGKFDNPIEMTFFVGEGKFVLDSSLEDADEDFDSSSLSYTSKPEMFVSFQRMSVPIPDFLQEALNLVSSTSNHHHDENGKSTTSTKKNSGRRMTKKLDLR